MNDTLTDSNITPVSLNCEIIPSFDNLGTANPNLTLIHGWGADNSAWQDWAIKSFSEKFTLHLIELPGFGCSPEISAKKPEEIESAWLKALANKLPSHTHLMGWSLGGLLSQKLAMAYPQKIQSLICIASTPRFTQLDNWSNAVSPSLLADFVKAIGIEISSVLKQFWRLQLQGSDNARPLMKKLTKHMTPRKLPKRTGLTQGLTLLSALDNRQAIKTIEAPTLWVLGEFDPLIPKALAQDLILLQPQSEVSIMQGASHMPFFSHPNETAQIITQFLKRRIESLHANL